jgi:hypothetical protein
MRKLSRVFDRESSSSFTFNTFRSITAPALVLLVALSLVLSACGGAASTSQPVTPAPAVASFSPTSGASGASVTITGTNLTGATGVTFGSKAASSFSVTSSTQITAVVATGSTTGKISVTTAGGTATSSGSFTVLSAPTLSSFNPASGPVGTSVVITGAGFTGATGVTFNSKAAGSFTVNSDTQITATVASGTTGGKIVVTTPLGTATSAASFTVTAPPTISSFNPGSGPVGTSVVITGTNFTGATAVAVNAKAASFTVNSATQITAVVASGSTSGKITLTTPAGTATSASNFTVTSSGATLDLSIDGLYITQATQEYPNPVVPLVQNRSAWVRVFAKANQANTATPQVKVDFINGSTTNTLTINAGSTSVPLSIDPENAAASWNSAVPAAWMQPGTHVTATVDPSNTVPEADETNNTFSATLDVRSLKTWKVTLVPVHTGDGLQGTVETTGRTRNDWVDFAKRIHPVADAIDVTVGSVMNSSVTTLQSNGTGWDTVLNEVTAKRSADGATDRYYFGAVHTNYSSGVAGLGWIGAPAAIGWDVAGSFPTVLAHEVGHNFGRQHSPCGNPSGVDPNYPYPGAVIGVPGWDVFASSNNLKSSSGYVDIMSYCSPVWVSDYTYLGVLNFRAGSAIGMVVPGPGSDSVAKDGLLIWGRIVDGQVTLEPAFRLPANSSLAEPGPYTWEARDAIGRVLASVSFSANEVADLPDNKSVQLFSFVVPLQADVLAAMQSIHIQLGNVEVAQKTQTAPVLSETDLQNGVRVEDLPDHTARVIWDADRYPVVMLRDAKTAEVRGFLRGGNAEIVDAPDQVEVHVSGGIQSSFLRHQRTGE